MNPQVHALIELLKASTPPDAPRLWQLPPPVARAAADLFFARFNEGGPGMAETRDIEVPGRRGGVPGRLYVPRGASHASPGVLYLHGGGFVIGSPATHDRLARELAEGTGARVVSLDYALAPEHPYPAGLDDCVDAARWFGAHADELGIDAARLVIGGDSAGATLAAATLLRLRDERLGSCFRGALLIYGQYADGETPSLQAWGDRDLILSRRAIEWFRDHYVPGGASPSDPYLVPLGADLSGFPPSIIVVGTLDPLLADSEMFAAALRKAGVPVELHVFEDGPHAFVQMPMLDMAADALAKLCAFARRCCSGE
jgi:acetyl esterase/lipase